MREDHEEVTEQPREEVLLELGRRIVRLRTERGWSQGELARRLGMSRCRLGKWERGLHGPPVEDLARLADVLGVDLEELVRGRAPGELSPGQRMELKACWANLMRVMKPLMEVRPRKARGSGVMEAPALRRR
jgi:transcriptional regulator with XRE-family HTH domain